ncbi:helix-turn-helix domain-containing protein [Methylobacterium sp. D53M]
MPGGMVGPVYSQRRIFAAGARARSGLSQGDVAKAMGTSQAGVSRWERGGERPSTVSIEKFAAATGARLEVRLIPQDAPETVAAVAAKPIKRGANSRRETTPRRTRAGSGRSRETSVECR